MKSKFCIFGILAAIMLTGCGDMAETTYSRNPTPTTRVTTEPKPLRYPEITIPELPYEISSGYQTIKISSIEHSFEPYKGDNSKVKIMITISMEVVASTQGEEQDYAYYDFKLLDEDGMVTKSGTSNFGNLSFGDKSKDTLTFYDIDVMKNYTLEINDA